MAMLPGELTQVTVHGKRVTIRRHGADAELRLVFLHGSGGSHLSFDELLPMLGEVAWVVPSLPGRGGSEGPPLASIADASEFVWDLARALDLRSFVVVGHSFGGAIAIEAALSRGGANAPALCGLVLVSTGARLRVHPDTLARVERGLQAGQISARDFVVLHSGAAPGLMDRIDAAIRDTPPETVLADLRAADAFDRMGRVHEIEVPALLLAGTSDPLTPLKYTQFLAQKIASAEMVLLDGAGHALPTERPYEVAHAIRGFVERLGAR
jgi:pimeloyl-ACP methyl ester carboxylesterase